MRIRLHWQNLSCLDGRRPQVKDHGLFPSLSGAQISIRKEHQRQETLTKMCKGWLLAPYMRWFWRLTHFAFLFLMSPLFSCKSSEFLKGSKIDHSILRVDRVCLTLFLLHFCFHRSYICRHNLLLRLNIKKDLYFYRCTVVYKRKGKY